MSRFPSQKKCFRETWPKITCDLTEMEYDGVYGVQKSSSKVIRVLHKRKNQIGIKNGPKSLNKMPYEK